MPIVLIVEDFEVMRETLCELLEPAYNCLAVRTAEEGLGLLGRADVVITDMRLPGMSGAEFLAEAGRRRPGLPVIVVTGGDVVLRERDFLELGAFGYLLKPFRAEEVEAMVRNAVEIARRGRSPWPAGAGEVIMKPPNALHHPRPYTTSMRGFVAGVGRMPLLGATAK